MIARPRVAQSVLEAGPLLEVEDGGEDHYPGDIWPTEEQIALAEEEGWTPAWLDRPRHARHIPGLHGLAGGGGDARGGTGASPPIRRVISEPGAATDVAKKSAQPATRLSTAVDSF